MAYETVLKDLIVVWEIQNNFERISGRGREVYITRRLLLHRTITEWDGVDDAIEFESGASRERRVKH